MFTVARNDLEKENSCVLMEDYISAMHEKLKTIVFENYITSRFSQ
jgi:hypothetical protein